jgi:hypothetical protein
MGSELGRTRNGGFGWYGEEPEPAELLERKLADAEDDHELRLAIIGEWVDGTESSFILSKEEREARRAALRHYTDRRKLEIDAEQREMLRRFPGIDKSPAPRPRARQSRPRATAKRTTTRARSPGRKADDNPSPLAQLRRRLAELLRRLRP